MIAFPAMEVTNSSTEESLPIILKIATYNIRNTTDRYEEREQLLKENIYRMDADIIGLQEVAFEKFNQIEELSKNDASSKYLIKDSKREKYQHWNAPLQIQYHRISIPEDQQFAIDGNAIMSDIGHLGKVLSHELLHLSCCRVAQKLTIELKNSRKINIINTHLHHLEHDLCLRLDQAHGILIWEELTTSREDVTIIMGDFNSTPFDPVYKMYENKGFTSLHNLVHGREPDTTFPTGLTAPYMDKGVAGCYDYIWIRGDGYKVKNVELRGMDPKEGDSTIYGSDHLALLSELEF